VAHILDTYGSTFGRKMIFTTKYGGAIVEMEGYTIDNLSLYDKIFRTECEKQGLGWYLRSGEKAICYHAGGLLDCTYLSKDDIIKMAPADNQLEFSF
jgi:hypothetical protein